MQFKYTVHWHNSKKYRPEITEDMLEYCITNSDRLNDKKWEEVYNAICRIPPSNRILKIAYRIEGKTIKILTAYWLDGN